MRPTTVEDAAALISIDEGFIKKTEALVRNNLGSHIKSSNVYFEIASEARADAVEKLLTIIKRKGKDWPLYEQALSSYGKDDCLITRYLYTSVRRYTTTRQYYWGKDPETGVPRYKARATGPSTRDLDNGQTNDDWLEILIEANSSKQKALDQQLAEVVQVLRDSSIPSELLEIVKMRGEGKTYPEIAEHMGMTKDSVRMKMNRAKTMLTELLR
ncbi:MAG: sigma-70 family RNA polymerase sigma factor [Flavobacteriaceae bacterium]|nr:sigma-70 family RNA polymerase sigma factor [Flavobacteriaceae bacterium]